MPMKMPETPLTGRASAAVSRAMAGAFIARVARIAVRRIDDSLIDAVGSIVGIPVPIAPYIALLRGIWRASGLDGGGTWAKSRAHSRFGFGMSEHRASRETPRLPACRLVCA
jgi:hypothetical protein